ncbi:MAG: TonB-dependent receptor [Pseudomonadota bacterium]
MPGKRSASARAFLPRLPFVMPWLLAATAPCALAGTAIEEIRVVGISPAGGAELPAARVPRHVQTLTSADFERAQSLDVSELLARRLTSVTVNAAQNNPLQPDVRYRGYTASPLLGLAQGVAVYVNGARVNEPLGDTVSWDLLPQSAVAELALTAGADPLFGMNALGGALQVSMKNGFDFQAHRGEVYGGSHDRYGGTLESGNGNDRLAYYVNISRFDESGWRDLSDSDATNAYASLGWRGARAGVELGALYGDSFLTGNGTVPVGLAALDRKAIFTAPDVTENELAMVTLEAEYALAERTSVSLGAFHRKNDTHAFNGDAAEYTVCRLGDGDHLLDGLEDDDVEALGLELDALCGDRTLPDLAALEAALARAGGAVAAEDLTATLSGSGRLAGDAVNNRSSRDQTSHGMHLQLLHDGALLGRDNHLVVGAAHYQGDSRFAATVELAELDPVTRSTRGLGTGTFLDGAATAVDTRTRTASLYASDTLMLADALALTLAGRYDHTTVAVSDRTGRQPELEGNHDFHRFNPAVGLTWQPGDRLNVYASYAESSRAPTPIELTCNEAVFERARARAVENGESAAGTDFECRLPNAFVADPPLDQVVARSVELGLRGRAFGGRWHLGAFRSDNRDDIVFQSSGRATGVFGQVDSTRRQGLEAAANGQWGALRWFTNYTYLRATFEDHFDATSPAHPGADADGNLAVRPGDRIPATPAHQVKVGADWQVTERLAIGGEGIYNAGQYLRGDPANQLDRLDGYAVVNLRLCYAWSPRYRAFARVDNVFDAEYENFGVLAEDPGEVIDDLPDERPRYVAPGAPRGAWIGLRVTL